MPTCRSVRLTSCANVADVRLRICDVIAGKAAPIITVADALQSLRTVKAVRRSIATGKTVALQALR